MICRAKFDDLERLELMGLDQEQPQWPLLKLVGVHESLNGELLEAWLLVDCASKLVKD